MPAPSSWSCTRLTDRPLVFLARYHASQASAPSVRADFLLVSCAFNLQWLCIDFALTSVLDTGCWGMDVSLLRTRSASLSAAVPSWEPSMSLPGIWWWCPCLTVSHLLRFTGFFRAFHREEVFVLTTWEDPRERQENIMRTWEDMDSYDIRWFVYEFLAVSIGVFLCLVILVSMWARSGRPCGRLSPGGDFLNAFFAFISWHFRSFPEKKRVNHCGWHCQPLSDEFSPSLNRLNCLIMHLAPRLASLSWSLSW